MGEAIVFLAPAMVMCLVIAAVHVYLGMHVLERGVIFVDLSLAQLAALGATIAMVTELHEVAWGARAGAFALTVLGAAIFALTRSLRGRVPQEAIIGIVYAVSSALLVLVLSQAAHGAEHLKDVLVGQLLLTTWEQVGYTAGAYLVLGGINVALASRFIPISWDQATAEDDGRHLVWWDLLFYVLFGIVITISVQVAGVLLVFSYLIVPAVITKLFSTRIGIRLVAGWVVALVASGMGLASSWIWDLPTGAAIVAAFGVLLTAAAAVRRQLRS